MHLGADAEHPIIIDTDDGDRARPRGQEQSSMEKSDVAWPVSSSRSVQPVEDIVHRTPAGANTFVNQPEAGPSQPSKLTPMLYVDSAAPTHGERTHGQLAVLVGAQRPTGSVANRLPGARRTPPSTPGPSADPYPSFKGFSSSESDGDGSSSNESVKSTSKSRHAVVAPDPAEGVRAIDLRTELDRGDNGRRATIARDGTTAQLSARGAQSSPSTRR
ncbi:hypothetical protein FOMPIDRAFT_1058436, partial [Fomitopsis schrenkii]